MSLRTLGHHSYIWAFSQKENFSLNQVTKSFVSKEKEFSTITHNTTNRVSQAVITRSGHPTSGSTYWSHLGRARASSPRKIGSTHALPRPIPIFPLIIGSPKFQLFPYGQSHHGIIPGYLPGLHTTTT